MADVGAESMVGGTTFHREMIQREISRALVLNLSGKASGATALPRIFLYLTAPSLLLRPTRSRKMTTSARFAIGAGPHAKMLAVLFRTPSADKATQPRPVLQPRPTNTVANAASWRTTNRHLSLVAPGFGRRSTLPRGFGRRSSRR